MSPELRDMVREYVEDTQGIMESLSSVVPYEVDRTRLEKLAGRLDISATERRAFVKEASRNPDALLGMLEKVSSTNERTIPSLGEPDGRGRGMMGAGGRVDPDQYLLQFFGVI